MNRFPKQLGTFPQKRCKLKSMFLRIQFEKYENVKQEVIHIKNEKPFIKEEKTETLWKRKW